MTNSLRAAQLGQFVLGGGRQCVAIGLVLGQQVPGEDGEFARDGDAGNWDALLACQASELVPEGSRVAAGMVGNLDQQPTNITVALLGDATVVGVFRRSDAMRGRGRNRRPVCRPT